MLFNSGVFLTFFAAFLLLYWLVRNNLRARNILILIASYVFYGWWDYRFLALLAFSSVVDFAVALAIDASPTQRGRRNWLALSIVCNLTILGFFKYYDFFATSFSEMLGLIGLRASPVTLGIILPVGISFYTFQAMSYTIDVYRGHLPANRNLVNFLAYVAFFPQLVAGPIERATHLLPQFERTLRIDRRMLDEGVWLMLWGMFKKVVIADNLDPLVRIVYGNTEFSAVGVILGTIAFGVQIYCDFSGYSDIARGLARVLGFELMVNFNLPYIATSVTEFWRRWHISLLTWLRDYLYISLGGNRRGTTRTYVNLLITMLLGGLWHGAAWNFVLWGLWHGMGLVAHRIFGGNKIPRVVGWLATMIFVFYGWLLFRAQPVDGYSVLHQIVAMTESLADWTAPMWAGSYLTVLGAFTFPLVAIEVWQHRAGNLLAPLTLRRWKLALLQGVLLIAICLFWERNQQPFIYFQF